MHAHAPRARGRGGTGASASSAGESVGSVDPGRGLEMHEQLLKDNAGARNAASGSTEPGYARARVLISCGPMRVTSACFGKWLVVGTIVVVLAALPVCVWELRAERHAEAHIVAWFVGGVFALLVRPRLRVEPQLPELSVRAPCDARCWG